MLPGAIGNRRRAGGLQIYVPSGHEVEPPQVTGVCHACGARFEEKGQEDAWQRHTVRCGKRNLDEIRAAGPRERNRGTIFDETTSDSPWDPEIAEHLQTVGRRMLREGRMEMLKSERVGS